MSRVQTFLGNPGIRNAYLRWQWQRVWGEPTIPLPGGAFALATRKFNDFYGLLVQHPSEAERVTFAQLLDGGGTYVDVGANMGLTALVAATTGKATRIFGVEPTHAYAQVWHANMVANGVRN